MKILEIHIYEFAELNEAAKAKAVEHFSDINTDGEWFESITEDFRNICGTIGISIPPDGIAFSGFYSQGDGSVFDAEVDLNALVKGILKKAWKGYAPKLDLSLRHPLIDRRLMQLLQKGIINPTAKIYRRGRGFVMHAEIEPNLAYHIKPYQQITGELRRLEEWLQEIAQNLNTYLYHALESDYDYLSSDEAVIESVSANGYHFTADGNFAGRLERLSETTTKNTKI